MTKYELVEKLMEMRAAAPHGHLTAMTQLFGIIFGQDIRDSGSNAAQIAKEAGIGTGWVEINAGQKLAGYVNVKLEVLQSVFVRRRDKPFELVTAGAGSRVSRRNLDKASALLEADDVERYANRSSCNPRRKRHHLRAPAGCSGTRALRGLAARVGTLVGG